MKYRTITKGLFVCLLSAAARAQADHVDFDRDLLVLKPDKQLEVRILRVNDKQVVYLQGSRETTVPRSQVARFQRSLDIAGPFLRSWQEAVDKREADTLASLARWCVENRLRKFARDAWLEVLLLDPQNDDANKALGHTKGAGGWLVPYQGASLPFAEVSKRHADWGNAWELASLHYDLRTDAPLGRALALLRDLEWFYLTFFAQYGDELQLDDRPERLVAHIYRDGSKVPLPSMNVGAYFDAQSRTLFTGFAGGQVDGYPTGLDHEATHQVFYHTLRYRATGGTVPAWLDEGLAEYMRTIVVRGRPGAEPKIEPQQRDEGALRTATQGREYRIERVLTLDSNDFMASSGQAEKYATAYALVWFLQFGDERRWRPRFFAFAREAYAGKGQSSTFKKVMGDLDKLKSAFESFLHGK